MKGRIKLYAWILGCVIGFGLPSVLPSNGVSDSLYILGLACLIGAIEQYRRLRVADQKAKGN